MTFILMESWWRGADELGWFARVGRMCSLPRVGYVFRLVVSTTVPIRCCLPTSKDVTKAKHTTDSSSVDESLLNKCLRATN